MPMKPNADRRSMPVWQRVTALAVVLGAALLVATVLWQLRRETLDGQVRELGVLSLALSDEVERGLQGAQDGLGAIGLELNDGLLLASAPAAGAVLGARADLMPAVAAIWLVDDRSRLLAASEPVQAPPLSTFAPALHTLPAGSVALSLPFVNSATGASMVAMAMRFQTGLAGEGGWMLAAMPADALRGAFSVAKPAADAHMAVFRADGARLAGKLTASADAALLRPPTLSPEAELLRTDDGAERLVSVRRLPRYGLDMVLTRELDAVLAPWIRFAQLSALGFAVLLATAAAAVFLVRRANDRHAQAQAALQAQRQRAGKLEALGTLAGGVAHDFNNILASIVGFGEMARDAAATGSKQARQLDKLQQSAARGKALVERILAFSRGGAHASTVFELEPVGEEVLMALSASLPAGIVIERAFDAAGARIRGDSTQVFEAIMNLCVNGMQAMPAGGVLVLRVDRRRVDTARVTSHAELGAGDYVALSVSDEGGGIAPEAMDRLFEPFFTTRAAQAGTGLGLAVVHGVVAELGGAIDVQSTLGAGTCFTLWLPLCAEPATARAAARAQVPVGGGQTLIVVDDAAGVLAMTSEMLSGLGYAAIGFGDPLAALQAVAEAPAAYAAFVTDERMPGMSGTGLAQAVHALAPDLPVLLVSGYGGAHLAARAAAAGVAVLLNKPLRREEIAAALADVLGRG